MSASTCCMRCTWLMVVAGACAATPLPRPLAPREDKSQQIDVENGRSSLGFVLESSLRARRTPRGRPTMFLELGNGATVTSGDRLQIFVRTSQNAYLNIAFCSQNAQDRRYAGLKVFPDQGAIHAKAYETTVAPDRAAEIVLDDKPGLEALYLILSRVELSSADSELAEVLAAARPGGKATDCGPPFRPSVAGPPKPSKPNRVWSGKSRRRDPQPSPSAASGARKQAKTASEEDPVVEIQRGGDIVWNNGISMGLEADPDGIVVLRYELTHVAAP